MNLIFSFSGLNLTYKNLTIWVIITGRIHIFLSSGFQGFLPKYWEFSIFWDITPCGPLKVNRRFGGICRLHLQGRRISQAKTSVKQVARRALILVPWRWKRNVPLKCRLTFNGLHGVITQKIEIFITTDVSTSNPTYLSMFSSLYQLKLYNSEW
jgi:hypothetical protein